VRECMRLSAMAEGRGFLPQSIRVEAAALQTENGQEDQRLIA